MTTQESERVGVAPPRTASTAAASKAYQRRIRRQQSLDGARLTRTGSPIASALSRVPFVAMIILLLAGGIIGVLWLNTMSDAAGLRASQSRLDQMDLSTSIQAANREIATLNDPGVLASQARSRGLVPPGDAAMLEIGKDGKGTVVGTPTPVPAADAPAAAAAAMTTVPTTAVPTTAVPTTKAATTKAPAPATKAPAPKAAAASTSAAARAAAAKTAAARAAAAKAIAAKAAPVKPTAAKSVAAKTTPVKPTTVGRSRQAAVTTGAGQ